MCGDHGAGFQSVWGGKTRGSLANMDRAALRLYARGMRARQRDACGDTLR